MSELNQSITPPEQRQIIALCILAAFADGAQGPVERGEIEKIMKGFSGGGLDLVSIYQQALDGSASVAGVAGQLQSNAAKALAYEMAVCVCNVDGATNDAELKFLAELHAALGLQSTQTAAHQQAAQALAEPPVIALAPVAGGVPEAELDQMIMNAAILNGALEIMPHTLANMAIVPLQMRLVYRIGKAYGFELDRGHITDFLATVGVGMASQVVEGFTRQLIGGFARRMTGGLLGGLVGQAAGSAFAFASTYALGQVAKKYYASGRTISAGQLKEVFATLLANGRSMQGGYNNQIMQRSRGLNVAELLPLTRSL